MENEIAVVTADMVNSTLFTREETNRWLKELIDLLKTDSTFDWVLKPEIYRGDSFQGVLKNPNACLRVAILSRAVIRSHAPNTDLRVAIGIGQAEQLSDRAGTSDGDAFRLSGHLADNIRKQKARIGIALNTPSEPLNSVLDLLETLIESWTPSQSEVIMALLQNETMTRIAERFSISQSAASQRAAAAKWWAIESFLTTFPKHLALYINTESTI